jgi:CMP-N-acetylneuraminic acid synthetase
MRAQSERVPGKNFRFLAGKPLFHHIITTLQQCTEIAEIAVDTDSAEIRDGLAQNFPDVRVIERPERLRAGEIPMNEILLHDAAQVAGDFYLQTHSTNPLLTAATVRTAIAAFLGAYPGKDSLFGVTELHTRLYDVQGKAINHNPTELLRTQDLPPVYEENSCLYIFTNANLKKRGHRIGENPLMFPISRDEAWDIDEEIDFQIADFLMRQRMSA